MAENAQPAGAGANGDAAAGIPFYEKSRQHLKELLQKRRALERQLAAHEEAIFQKESDYLENTPTGNVITGFDNYIKGTSSSAAAAAARRKTGHAEANRVFSRSSISYNIPAQAAAAAAAAAAAGANESGAGTPGSTTPASHAPTPASAGFRDGSAAGTPTASSGGGGGGGAAGSKNTSKKKKSAAAHAVGARDGGGGGGGGGGVEESEGEAREGKKVRTNFGVVKKS